MTCIDMMMLAEEGMVLMAFKTLLLCFHCIHGAGCGEKERKRVMIVHKPCNRLRENYSGHSIKRAYVARKA